MKKSFLVIITIIATALGTSAQVGIGAVPKDSSILDLTNSSGKYLILPVTNTDPTTVLKNNASVIYHEGNLYMKTPDGIKVFTPWKWDGDSAHAISSPADASVGIGVVPAVSNYRLQVSDCGEVKETSPDSAAIIIGDPGSHHLLIDNNEIMAKKDPNTADTLRFQEESGAVAIRSATNSGGNNNVLKAYGSIEATGNIKANANLNAMGNIQEKGRDLIPKGSIIMWNGSTDSAGYPMIGGVVNKNWHLCDGTVGTPDLRERFIVGTGDNPLSLGGPYPIGTAGGKDTVQLNTSQIPSHNHEIDDPKHRHEIKPREDGGESRLDDSGTGGSSRASAYTELGVTGITIKYTGSNQPHENRPPYYALAYIMKL